MNKTAQDERRQRELKARAVLCDVDDLPSIPETLILILRVLDDPNSSAQDLADVVRYDLPLMAKILRLANSPYYSGSGEFADIKSCVGVLGFRTVRQVAICVTIATSLVAACGHARGRLDYRELWRHSVITGAFAKHLAQVAGLPYAEEIFTAGLLHDLGKFVLIIFAPEKYDQIILARADTDAFLPFLERAEFGFDHADAGASFATSWRFPKLLVLACAGHHEVVISGIVDEKLDRSLAVVRLADYLANTLEPAGSDLGFSASACDPPRLHADAGFTEETIAEQRPLLSEAVSSVQAFLDLT